MIKKSLCFFILLSHSLSWSQPPQSYLLKTPDTPNWIYQKTLREKNKLNYVEWYSQQHIHSIKTLLDIYELAQFEWIDGNPHRSQQHFLSIVEHSLQRHYQRSANEIFALSFFKIYQITENKKWLKNLRAQFHTIADWQSFLQKNPEISDSLFEVEFFNKSLLAQKNLTHWTHLVINGRVYSMDQLQQLQLVETPYRFTVLSDTYGHKTVVANPNDFFISPPLPDTRIEKNCTIQTDKVFPLTTPLIVNANGCVDKWTQNDQDGIQHKINREDLAVSAPIGKLPLPALNSSVVKSEPNLALPPPKNVHSEKTWYKNPWVWGVGIGALVVLSMQNKHEDSQSPVMVTHSEGF